MVIDISGLQGISRINPREEILLTKVSTELTLGQELRAVVVKSMPNNEVLLNIAGRNLAAKTNYDFPAGQVLNVKVMQGENELILKVMPEPARPNENPIQAALMQSLPKQAPATNLLATLSNPENIAKLPEPVRQQVQQLLSTLTPLSQLPQQIIKTVQQSGYFLESNLFNLAVNGNQPAPVQPLPTPVPTVPLPPLPDAAAPPLPQQQTLTSQSLIQNDFKAMSLRLLAMIDAEGTVNKHSLPTNEAPVSMRHESIQLPGAVPQPLHKINIPVLKDLPIADVLGVLHEQTEQALARINSGQINYMKGNDQMPFTLMLDVPVRTENGPEVIPMKIEENRPTQEGGQSSWSLSFAASLNELGDIQGKVTLHDNIIDVQVNVEKSSTIDLLYANQQAFADLIADTGLTLESWAIRQGLEENHIDASQMQLLDIKI
ncbi:flagellar hook-length control protein FliK [Legionella dresdenensis]|uniref:Flagellar hook-length control protein FliK n=1 Tax=Legionella dresdenensis TaxID=450200 RepID=A0ABV8CCN4_9GAMM